MNVERQPGGVCQRLFEFEETPGVDSMTVDELAGCIGEHKQEVIASLLDGTYRPQPVRGVEIPKPGERGRSIDVRAPYDTRSERS